MYVLMQVLLEADGVGHGCFKVMLGFVSLAFPDYFEGLVVHYRREQSIKYQQIDKINNKMPNNNKKLTLKPTITIPLFSQRPSLKPTRAASLRPYPATLEPRKHSLMKEDNKLPTLNLKEKPMYKLSERTKVTTASRSKLTIQETNRLRSQRLVSCVTRKEGLTSQQHYLRKESHLNSYFNKRKDKLKQITKQNKKIYVRINSQKSLYSSRALSQSSEASISLSRKLSESKMSRRSSLSKNSVKKQRKIGSNVSKNEIRICSHDINKVKTDEMEKFVNIFSNHNAIKRASSIKPSFQRRKSNMNAQIIVEKENENHPKELKIPRCSALQQIVEELSMKPKVRSSVLKNRVF